MDRKLHEARAASCSHLCIPGKSQDSGHTAGTHLPGEVAACSMQADGEKGARHRASSSWGSQPRGTDRAEILQRRRHCFNHHFGLWLLREKNGVLSMGPANGLLEQCGPLSLGDQSKQGCYKMFTGK